MIHTKTKGLIYSRTSKYFQVFLYDISLFSDDVFFLLKCVLLGCKVFNDTRKHYFHVNTMKDLFENNVLSFLKESGLYQKI